MSKVLDIREDEFYPIQASASRAFRERKFDKATLLMADVPTLVAAVVPVLTEKLVKREEGEIVRTTVKVREDVVIYVNRLHPRNL